MQYLLHAVFSFAAHNALASCPAFAGIGASIGMETSLPIRLNPTPWHWRIAHCYFVGALSFAWHKPASNASASGMAACKSGNMRRLRFLRLCQPCRLPCVHCFQMLRPQQKQRQDMPLKRKKAEQTGMPFLCRPISVQWRSPLALRFFIFLFPSTCMLIKEGYAVDAHAPLFIFLFPSASYCGKRSTTQKLAAYSDSSLRVICACKRRCANHCAKS